MARGAAWPARTASICCACSTSPLRLASMADSSAWPRSESQYLSLMILTRSRRVAAFGLAAGLHDVVEGGVCPSARAARPAGSSRGFGCWRVLRCNAVILPDPCYFETHHDRLLVRAGRAVLRVGLDVPRSTGPRRCPWSAWKRQAPLEDELGRVLVGGPQAPRGSCSARSWRRCGAAQPRGPSSRSSSPPNAADDGVALGHAGRQLLHDPARITAVLDRRDALGPGRTA